MANKVAVDIICNTCCVGKLFVGFIDWKHNGDEFCWKCGVPLHPGVYDTKCHTWKQY